MLTTNGQVSEEEPSGEEGLLGRAGWLAQDVQIRGVEAQGGGRKTVCNQVHPQQLHWDQSLRQTKSSSQEDTEGRVKRGKRTSRLSIHAQTQESP